jgi:hypothetical protein
VELNSTRGVGRQLGIQACEQWSAGGARGAGRVRQRAARAERRAARQGRPRAAGGLAVAQASGARAGWRSGVRAAWAGGGPGGGRLQAWHGPAARGAQSGSRAHELAVAGRVAPERGTLERARGRGSGGYGS